jgi:hypothetical protein
MKRGVGYCENINCDNYLKDIFVINQDRFFCPRCREKGFIEVEKYSYSNDFSVIREVRVEFDYDPLKRCYRSIAIATDNELGSHCNVLTVQNPLCKTEKRGLKLAELYFAYVSLNGVGVKNLNSTENTIDFGAPPEIFKEQLRHVSEKWERSATLRKEGLPYAQA